MACGFDEVDDYFSIADPAELTLQDGDWAVGVWTYVTDNPGEAMQYLLSNNDYSVNNSINLWLVEVGGGGNAGAWQLNIEDGDGTNPGVVTTSSNPGGDSKWRLIVVQRDVSVNEIQIWFCESGGTPSKEASVADTNFGAVDGGDWNIGRRVDGSADRYYGGTAAEIFKMNDCLTQAEIEVLGAGLPILTLAAQIGATLDLWLPMWVSEATLTDLSGNGNDATRHSMPTTEEHAPICTPVKRRRM